MAVQKRPCTEILCRRFITTRSPAESKRSVCAVMWDLCALSQDEALLRNALFCLLNLRIFLRNTEFCVMILEQMLV